MTDIRQNFDRFKSNLEITTLQQETVSVRQKTIREVIESKFNVLETFLTGSYIRQTMIAPLTSSDIDIFAVLSSKHYNVNGQLLLLNSLKDALRVRYPSTPKISPNGQAVTITFTDFKVDVVPAFNREGGGFLIPDSQSNTWISTNPKTHIQYKISQNAYHNGNLVPLIKMIKCWNREWGTPFTSFYLELLISKILTNITISDYPSGVRYFFDKARDLIRYKIDDPAGLGGSIGGFNSGTTISSAVALLERSYVTAVEAERLAREVNSTKAAQHWQIVFGEYFPVYL